MRFKEPNMRFTFIAFIAFMIATVIDVQTKGEKIEKMQMPDVGEIILVLILRHSVAS